MVNLDLDLELNMDLDITKLSKPSRDANASFLNMYFSAVKLKL